MKIIIDTREKQPLDFGFIEIERIKLDEGDYTARELLDYEEKTGSKTVRIERKASITELANNLSKGFDTFEKEMKRLFDYERKILLLEFNPDNIKHFPFKCGLPNHIIFRKNKKGKYVRNIRMDGTQILNKLEYIKNIYDVEIIFAGSREYSAQLIETILQDAIQKIS